MDCREEQKQTHQALEALEDGFQAHISHLSERLLHLSSLSCPEAQELHINLLGQLTVGRAILEAQAQIRLESLQRYWLPVGCDCFCQFKQGSFPTGVK